MKISELEKRLAEIKAEHGDLEVRTLATGEDGYDTYSMVIELDNISIENDSLIGEFVMIGEQDFFE